MPHSSSTISPSSATTTNPAIAAANVGAPTSGGFLPNSNNNSNPHQRAPSNMSAGMNRVLAHSTSLLANDSYIAGMSSDSELTSSRHHHRPYSSQSRVYHAHPAPRSSHTLSRVSHYSDSAAATYVPSANKLPPYDTANSSVNSSSGPGSASGSSSSNTNSGQLQQSHNHPRALGNPHLTPQSSLASSGSAASTPGAKVYYQSTGFGAGSAGLASSNSESSAQSAMMTGTPQQGNMSSPSSLASSRPLITSSGRQLPHRPFKQSLSIDHYNTSSPQHQPQHRHMIANVGTHHHQLANMPSRQPLSPHHFDSIDVSASYKKQLDNKQQQQQRLLHHDQMPRYDQRDFQSEIDKIEKQTAALRLYDSSDTSSLPPLANRVPVTPTGSSPRHLPPSSPVSGDGSGSSSGQIITSAHHHHQQFHLSDHHQASQMPSQLARKQPQHQHHPSELYAAHLQYSSSPSDWLPPMGMSAHHLNRATAASANPTSGQFKQTMSIDHYPIGAQQQHQQQQQFYSPNRHAFRDHYRSLGYPAANSPISSYTPESPTHHQTATEYAHHQQQQQQSAPGSFDNQNATSAVVDRIYHQYTSNREHQHIEQRLAESTFRDQQRQLHESSRYSTGPSSSLGYASHQDSSMPAASEISKGHGHQQQQQLPTNSIMQQQPANKLQHQISSSSSESRSGSLRSSNADLNRSTSLEQQGRKSSSSLPHSQHQGLTDHHQQQQQLTYQQPTHHNKAPHRARGALRKGYTSVVSSLGGSVNALNESLDFSPSHASHMLHLTSSAGTGVANKRSGLRASSPSAAFDSAISGPGMAGRHQQQHHSSPGTSKEVLGAGSRSESSTGPPNGGGGGSSSALTKKSNSATQLSMTGTKKRLGFRKKQVTSFSVHRSEEVAPLEARHLVKQGSSVSEGDSSMSGDSSSRSWSNSNFKQPTSDELASMNFIDGLGKGQMISRQGLASPYLGDIQLSLCDRRGNLEVEIIRARNLQAKTNKVLPLTYVKLYLVKNRKCLAKAKTTLSNKRTLDPLFQQQLTFHEDYHGCILQSIIWGNFGKMDKKNFMGIAQISIDDLELSETVISWYKLFLPSSLQTLPSKSLRHTLLSNSTESFTNTNNS